MSVEYNWLGQLSKKNRVSVRGDRTKTAEEIKEILKKNGAEPYKPDDVSAKNLMKKNGTKYYILSISGEMWAAYKNILNEDNGCAVLTQDTDDPQRVNMWVVSFEKIMEMADAEDITFQERGGYYGISPKVLEKYGIKPKTVSLSEIPGEIFKNGGEG